MIELQGKRAENSGCVSWELEHRTDSWAIENWLMLVILVI